MKTATPKSRGGRRPGAGRPATGKDPVRAIRLSDEFLEKVDGWAAQQTDRPGRSEAIRRLVELGLKVRPPAKPGRKTASKLRARELAANTIEGMIDRSAPPEERAQRKRRLTKGPSEFREDRIDLPKPKH
jgi:alkanesulfonate monooxygenase SsuD/methylene tetrahydromethanopterin reductase-like flavin-dependent oxidoreductase (luciferase family)